MTVIVEKIENIGTGTGSDADEVAAVAQADTKSNFVYSIVFKNEGVTKY